MGGELKAVMGDHHVDAVAFQRQLIGLTDQVDGITRLTGRIYPVVNGTALKQGLSPRDTHLQDVVTKGLVEQVLHGLSGALEQVTPVVLLIPGFQFRQNIAKLAIHSRRPGPLVALGRGHVTVFSFF